MAIGLHEQCKARLTDALVQVLPEVTVSNGRFVDRTDSVIQKLLAAEEILPKTGPIINKLQGYISETPFFDFVFELVSREIYESQQYDDNAKEVPLGNIEGFEDHSATASRLVAEFDSLPWEYTFTIKMAPNLGIYLDPEKDVVLLSNALSLVRLGESLESAFPLVSGIPARDESLRRWKGMLSFMDKGPIWDNQATYLQLRIPGYVGKYAETGPTTDAISCLKSFCGLAIAIRFLDLSVRFRIAYQHPMMLVHRRHESSWEILRYIELDSEISEAMAKLELDDLNGHLVTNEDKKRHIANALGQMQRLYSQPDKAARILLASRWLFDSYCSRNELLSFVQLTVVIEILLGEKSVSDIMGLGELLRNRCAYLIGKSHQQRESILKDFKDIYEVRSHIVHRGKSKLSTKERSMKSRLRWMCSRVIQEECRLLEKDNGQA